MACTTSRMIPSSRATQSRISCVEPRNTRSASSRRVDRGSAEVRREGKMPRSRLCIFRTIILRAHARAAHAAGDVRGQRSRARPDHRSAVAFAVLVEHRRVRCRGRRAGGTGSRRLAPIRDAGDIAVGEIGNRASVREHDGRARDCRESLGMGSLSQFDHFGRPLRETWRTTPDQHPTLRSSPSRIWRNATRQRTGRARVGSARFQRSRSRGRPQFNVILWHAMKGDSHVPAPRTISLLELARAR